MQSNDQACLLLSKSEICYFRLFRSYFWYFTFLWFECNLGQISCGPLVLWRMVPIFLRVSRILRWWQSQSFREFTFGTEHSWYGKVPNFMLMTRYGKVLNLSRRSLLEWMAHVMARFWLGVLRWNGSLMVWQGCGYNFVWIRFDLSYFQRVSVELGWFLLQAALFFNSYSFSLWACPF